MQIYLTKPDTRQHLRQFYFKTHRRLPQSFTLTQMKRKWELRLPFFASPLSATAPRVSFRRGARSSCLHVHVSLARVARGSDPHIPVMRLLSDSVHNAEELSQQPDSLSQASHLLCPLSIVPLRTLSRLPPLREPPSSVRSPRSPCELSLRASPKHPQKLRLKSSLASHLIRTLNPNCSPFCNRGLQSSFFFCRVATGPRFPSLTFPPPRPVQGTRELVLARKAIGGRKGRET